MKKTVITRVVSCLLTAALVGSSACMTASLAAVTGLELGYSGILNAVVNSRDTCTYEKNFKIDGRTAVKIVPNDASTLDDAISLDSWDLASKEFDLDSYNYAVVYYKYDTDDPSYFGYMNMDFMTNGGALNKSVSMQSVEPVKAGEWSTVTFCIGSAAKPKLSVLYDTHILHQLHFYPYGRTSRSLLSEKDVMYIEKIVLTKTNPNPDMTFSFQFYPGEIKAKGNNPEPVVSKAGEAIYLPKCPYTLDGAKFVGWLFDYDGKVYEDGNFIEVPEFSGSFTAKWEYEKVDKDAINLVYPSYYMKGDDYCHAATAVTETEDGIKSIKVGIAKDREKDEVITLNGWEYTKANVDLDKYKYLQVTYKYVSENPRPDLRLGFKVMTFSQDSDKHFTGPYYAESEETMDIGIWSVATIDLSGAESVFAEGVNHVFRQAYVYPFGETSTELLDENDVVFVATLDFFKEKPGMGSHKTYINGYSDGTFKPEGTMTRAEACTIAARLLAGGEYKIPTDLTASFTDIAEDAWYRKYIAYCESQKLLGAYSGEFLPDKAITRAEFVELIYNMNLTSGGDKQASFTDVAENHPRYNVIMASAKAGIINGYNNGDGTYSFKPDNTISRAEVVKVINNASGRRVDASSIPFRLPTVFKDIDSTHWAFYEVMEASVGHKIKSIAEDGKELWDSTVGLEIKDFSDGIKYVEDLDAVTAERIAAIRATETSVKYSGKAYYVSADGSDENEGTSPDKAWKTLDKVSSAKLASGDAVLFRRGDTFRGNIAAKAGVTYSAYGEGAKPVITASPENANYASAWEKTEVANVYKYHERVTEDVGTIVMNEGERFAVKVVVDTDGITNRTTGTPFKGIEDLENNFFWHDPVSKQIYYRLDEGNPGELYDTVELNRGVHGLRVSGSGVTVDNLCFMYCGAHGISAPSTNKLTVTNCEVGFIGGSFQGSSGITRYGNGVEIFGSCDGYLIDNCYVYQCYDAGITHQFNGGTNDCVMKNVTYTNNVIEKCIYNIEYFNSASDNVNAVRRMENILIKDNILRSCGMGFGQQRPDRGNDAHIRGGGYNRADNYVIEGNVFDRGRSNLLYIGAQYSQWLPVLKNNTYVQHYGRKGIMFGAPQVTYMYSGNVGEAIEKELGDTEYTVYFVPNEPAAPNY